MHGGFRTFELAGRPVLAPAGPLDLGALPRWHDALSRLVDHHPGVTVVVDLDEVTSIDDLAVGVLLSAAARARDRGGSLELVATSEHLRLRLGRLGIDLVVPVRPRLAP